MQEIKSFFNRFIGAIQIMTTTVLWNCFSLGVSTRSEERLRVEGIREEAIHIRGIDNMTTQDVFHFFKDFNPGSIEWIDETSCMCCHFTEVVIAKNHPNDNMTFGESAVYQQNICFISYM